MSFRCDPTALCTSSYQQTDSLVITSCLGFSCTRLGRGYFRFDLIFIAPGSVGITTLIFTHYSNVLVLWIFLIDRYETTYWKTSHFFYIEKWFSSSKFGNHCSNPEVPQKWPKGLIQPADGMVWPAQCSRCLWMWTFFPGVCALQAPEAPYSHSLAFTSFLISVSCLDPEALVPWKHSPQILHQNWLSWHSALQTC